MAGENTMGARARSTVGSAPQSTDSSGSKLNRRTFIGRVCGVAALPLLAACGQATAPAAPTAAPAAAAKPTVAPVAAAPAAPASVSTPAPAAAQPRTGGTLRAATVGEYVTLDGHYYSPKVGLATWVIHDTLTRYDDELKVQPMLAESWDQSADRRQLKLNLRKGVTFHNGREMTADDILYNFTRVTDPKITAGIITGFIPPNTTWEAPDKYTVVVKSVNPWPAVFDWLEVVGITDRETMEGPDAKTKSVATGPFAFKEWVQGDHLTYVKNKNYWQTGRPYLDEIRVSILKDQQAMVSQLEAGAIDLAMTPPLKDFTRLKSDKNYQGVLFPSPPDFYMIQPNATLAPLTDKRVRQAFAYTIDRQRMRDAALDGIGEVKSLPWSPGSAAYEPEKNSAYSFDLDKARSMLEQAGATNLELEMVYNNQSLEGAAMSQIWQADLAKINVKLNLQGLQSAQLLDMWHNQTYKGFYIASDAWTNMQPITFFTSSSVARTSGNNGGYMNATYTEMVDKLALEPDEAKRKQQLSALNDFMLEEGIVYPIATNVQKLLASTKVKDIGNRRIPLFKFTETWLEG
jgi:peptide/nickel transport system substrate-binding protein